MTFRWLAPVLAAGLLVASPHPAAACPACVPQGQTLASEVAQADFILYGTLANAQRDPNDFDKGTTDLNIELVIKSHDMVKGKKVLTIPRYVPPDPKNPNQKFLIFFNVNPVDGKIDPYRGEAFPPDSKLPDYLKGAIEVRNKDITTRLLYFFEYLEDKDPVISTDAYNEFAVAEYKEVRPVAEKLQAKTLLAWLKDPNTRPYRYGLYGLMLGHCGKAEDAKALRELLDDPSRSFVSGLDGLVLGYILLDPKAGWEYLIAMVKDPKREFPIRYAGLKTVRFMWEYRPDVISHSQALEAMKLLMQQPDLADLPIEDLRKWQVWELTPVVLGYAEKESHNAFPIVNRAILKYAIAAAAADPKNQAAVEFVKQARAKDAKKVEFLEELIRDEQRPVLTPSSPPGPKK
ncbi:MAG TPA: hypothetical protein VKE74_07430 [Gemmataceae bacterium]|nr:hypothetical protein [Gemmataceae bacterium]